MSEPIPLSVPEFRGNEWAYLKECIDTGWVSSVGAFVDRFEADMARTVDSMQGVAVVNGTSALHLALLTAGVKAGDLVLCSTLTFIASANAIRYTGAEPVFVDAEAEYAQIDVRLIEAYLRDECEIRDGQTFEKASGRRVAALMPVHVLGMAGDLDAMLALGSEFGVPVVEDAAEALGVRYKGKPIGAHPTFATCFSFNGNKILTTGGGGAITYHDRETARAAKRLATQAKDDALEYIHGDVAYNYRMPNLLAAMGCAQLEQLPEYVEKKQAIANRYIDALKSIPGLEPILASPDTEGTYWLFTIKVDPAVYGETARELVARLGQAGIQSRPLWQPMHLSPAHAGARILGGEVATKLFETAVSLPCSVGLNETDQERVIGALRP